MEGGTGMESVEDVDTNRSEMGSSKIGSVGGFSASGEANADLGNSGEILTRIELDLACTSEKLYNLNMLMMHVATREDEFEVFDPGEEEGTGTTIEKGMEFDLLSGILDSEVEQLDSFMTTLQKEILDSRVWMSSSENLGESFLSLEDKLSDSERTLEQLREQLSELQTQSAEFQETLSRFMGKEKRLRDTGFGSMPNGGSLNLDSRSKMPTAEQQMHFLRVLEKSLARELDLEKKLSEARQTEEELKQQVQSAEQEAFCLEEEVFDTWGRLFETDNFAEVLMGVSKELLVRLQISQFNLNGLSQRESDLRSKLDAALDKLQEKDNDLRESKAHENELKKLLSEDGMNDILKVSKSQKSAAQEVTCLIERRAEESEPEAEVPNPHNVIEQLKLELSEAVERAYSAEAKSNLLEDTNKQLHEDLCLLRCSGLTPERVQSLENQLKESDILLQHAMASAEAGEEKQLMLYSTISDMENTIEELKRKVSKAESRADSVEDKCIILSETNAELNEELGFLRNRLECLEGSLHLAEETKLATAKSVGVHTRAISNLMKQLAVERERLNGQLTSLVKENRILVVQLRNNGKYSTVIREHEGGGGDREISPPAVDFQEPKSSKVHNGQVNDYVVDDTKVELEDPTSQTETVRRIDAGALSFKHGLIAGLIILLITSAYLYSQHDFLLT